LARAWPLNVPGFHRVILGDDVTLDLLVGAVDAVLPQVTARVNDSIWRPAHRRMGAHAGEAGSARRDAARASGRRGAGVGADGSRLRMPAGDGDGDDIAAVYRAAGRRWRAPEPVRRAVVIGAGLAGSSAAHRLCARGWQVTLIERHAQPAQEASGNLAASSCRCCPRTTTSRRA
jgi:tRNA 5-methylaminomethyl-2-thiouridine biosynthesis bifunctional protein